MSLDGPNTPSRNEIQSLRDLSPHQWKSGIAAWLGWLFDGLDQHLYVLVAAPFVAELIGVSDTRNENVGRYSSWIQAAFLVGWAIGGGFFGRIGDRIGRIRALSLTILTYALFTGLAFFAQTWWQLLVVRFLAALGIGGEWAVGASLLAQTWPHRWRPWIAAVLQSGVNIGILLASCTTFLLAGWSPRVVFLDVHFVTRSSVLIDLDYSGSLWERGSSCTKITLGPQAHGCSPCRCLSRTLFVCPIHSVPNSRP